MRPVVGLVDNPYAAKQLPLTVDFPRGNVVVFSAYASPAVCNKCLELGANVVFDKTDLGSMLEYCRGVARGKGANPAGA